MSDIKEGLDGWLFLTGGSNQVLRFYTDPDFFTDDQVRSWMRLLKTRRDRLSALSIAYFHLVPPDKISVLPQFFGAPLEHFAAHPLARILDLAGDYRLQTCIVDTLAALGSAEGRFPAYYKTDSHWTVWGAYIAYALTCRTMGLPKEAVVEFDQRQFGSYPTLFDLGAKLPEPRTELSVFASQDPAVTRISANAIVELREAAEKAGSEAPMHHGVHAVFRSGRAGCVPGKLVIFGDSFADYRPSTMTAFFAETFAETHFIWSAGLDFDYIERVRPDFVLTEIAERFMTALPTDDYQVEAFARARVEAYLARTGQAAD